MFTHAQAEDVYRQSVPTDVTCSKKTGDPLALKNKETASENEATLSKSEK